MAAGLLFLCLSGCVSTSQLAQQIVSPSRQMRFAESTQIIAEPFYSHRISMRVSAPDAGVIDAAIIEPAPYDPKITIWYTKNKPKVKMNLNFPRLPAPPETAKFKRFAGNEPFVAYAERLRKWLPTLQASKPVGTMIMLPGFGMNKAGLMSWAVFFADRGWRIVVVDLRGQGASTAPYLTWGIRDRDDLHHLIKVLGDQHLIVRPWIYFGISYGAGVALMAAGNGGHPDGVIVLAPWESASDVIPRFAHSVAGPLAPSRTSPKWASAEREADRLAGISLQEARPTDSVASIEVPVLYLGGGADEISPPESIKLMAQKTHDATVAIKPGLTHIVAAADVPGFCDSINHWLAKTVLRHSEVRNCSVTETADGPAVEEVYVGDK